MHLSVSLLTAVPTKHHAPFPCPGSLKFHHGIMNAGQKLYVFCYCMNHVKCHYVHVSAKPVVIDSILRAGPWSLVSAVNGGTK